MREAKKIDKRKEKYKYLMGKKGKMFFYNDSFSFVRPASVLARVVSAKTLEQNKQDRMTLSH